MMRTGLERLLAKPDTVRGRRVGLIANHTSVAGGFRYGWDLLGSAGVDIRKIFSPEHGLFGTEQDQVAVACIRYSLQGREPLWRLGGFSGAA